MIAAVASSLLWKFQTPLRQTATHLFVLLTDDAYEYIAGIFLSNKDESPSNSSGNRRSTTTLYIPQM